MKRLVVSAIVVVAFVVYAVFFRGETTAPTTTTADIVAVTTTGNAAVTTAPSSTTVGSSPTAAGGFEDGTYTGTTVKHMYGPVQVQITIEGGKLTDIQFLQQPSGRGESNEINSFATPILVQEAIAAQSAQVDVVSGATLTSRAFMESLQSALDQA